MAMQLPAHLANLPNRGLAARATQGMGSPLPPRISVASNQFTLIDAANNEHAAGPTIEAVIADISSVLCKRYMDPDKKWTPDSNDAPLCWSSNGIGPSSEAAVPQSATCAACPNNKRGSKISEMTGASVKACRDELYLALLLPKYPDMMFRLVVTPGSFKNWQDFTALFKGHSFDMDKILTQFSFAPKPNGVLQFKPTAFPGSNSPFIDAVTANAILAALNEKKTDVLCGRLDRPRGAEQLVPTQGQLNTAPTGGLIATLHDGLVAAAPIAASQSMPTAPAPTQIANPAPAVSPSEPVPAAAPRRRGRPSKADTQATPAPAFGNAPANDFGTIAASQGVAQAPFMPSEPPVTSDNSGFGIQKGVAPNPDLQSAIDNMFGPQP